MEGLGAPLLALRDSLTLWKPKWVSGSLVELLLEAPEPEVLEEEKGRHNRVEAARERRVEGVASARARRKMEGEAIGDGCGGEKGVLRGFGGGERWW